MGKYDVEQFGVAQYLYQTGFFWTVLLACALASFGHRLLERGYVWLFRPQVQIPSRLSHPLPLSPLSSFKTLQALVLDPKGQQSPFMALPRDCQPQGELTWAAFMAHQKASPRDALAHSTAGVKQPTHCT